MAILSGILGIAKRAISGVIPRVSIGIQNVIRNPIIRMMRLGGAKITDIADTLGEYETKGTRESRLTEATGIISAYDSASVLLDLNRTIDVPQYLMSERDLPTGKRYLVIGRVNYIDARTKTEQQKWASFYTNDMGSLGELEEQFSKHVRDKDKYEQYQVISIDFEEVRHNRGLGY